MKRKLAMPLVSEESKKDFDVSFNGSCSMFDKHYTNNTIRSIDEPIIESLRSRRRKPMFLDK